jgi:hypothetical protein
MTALRAVDVPREREAEIVWWKRAANGRIAHAWPRPVPWPPTSACPQSDRNSITARRRSTSAQRHEGGDACRAHTRRARIVSARIPSVTRRRNEAAARAALQWPHLETIDPGKQTAHGRGILDGAVHKALECGGGCWRDAGGLCRRKNVGQRLGAGHPRILWDCQRCRIPWQRIFMVGRLERHEDQSVCGRCPSSLFGKFSHGWAGAADRPLGGKFAHRRALAAARHGVVRSDDGRRHATDYRSLWDPERCRIPWQRLFVFLRPERQTP